MAKSKAKKGAPGTQQGATTRRTQQRGGGRMMGEGENFGKGQTRRGRARVPGEEVTRRGTLGMRGRQETGESQRGGTKPTTGALAAGARRRGEAVDTRRHDANAIDFGGLGTEPPLQSSARPQDKGYERRREEEPFSEQGL